MEPDDKTIEKLGREFGKTFAQEIEKRAKEIGQNFTQGVTEEVLKALNSINWEKYGQQVAAGIRKEFEAAMDKLFADKIEPLLEDIDLILKTRIDQADSLIDALIQKTFEQFQTVVDQTIAKIGTDIIDHAFNRFATERDKTIAQIRAEVIDYTAATINKTTAEIVEKVKVELIDHTFAQLDQLRKDFRRDVNHFFDRAENLIVLLDCTEEKIRLDLESTRKDLDKLGEKYLKEIKELMPQAQASKITEQISNLLPFGKQSSTKPTTSTTTQDSCYQQLGVTEEALEGFEYSTIYDLKTCKLLNTLTQETPIRRVQNVYLDLEMFAKRVACIQQNPTHFMWDWLAFKSRYQFWSNYRY